MHGYPSTYHGNLPDFTPLIERPSDMPLWQDCSWRRKKCDKPTCKFCTLHNEVELTGAEALERYIDESVMSMDYFEDDPVERRGGFDLTSARQFEGVTEDRFVGFGNEPEWSSYPLYLSLRAWNEQVFAFFRAGYEKGEAWIQTEPGQDLMWYGNYLAPKTGRLLHDRWNLDETDMPADFIPYAYDRYVVAQCLLHTEQALLLLGALAEVPPGLLQFYQPLCKLAKKMMEI